jgi:DNA-binding MarR family transcriptional regulator
MVRRSPWTAERRHERRSRRLARLARTAGGRRRPQQNKVRHRFGLSISRFDVLATLDRAYPEGLRAGELSQRLRVTEGNITQVAAPLIRDGLVRRTHSEEDGRVAILNLTKKGRNLFSDMAEQHRLWVANAFSGLSSEQLQTLRMLLGRLRRPLDAQTRRDAA